MKIKKLVSTAVVSAAMAATMAITASAAASADSVVDCAKVAGFQSHNVEQLSNFLEANGSKFESAQFETMCKDIERVANNVIYKYASQEDIAAMDDDAKEALFKKMTEEDRQAIIKACVDAGTDVGVKVTVTKRNDNHGYDVSATIESDDGKKQTTPADNTNPKTGDVNSVNAAAAVMAAISIALAGTGIVVVAKKNREN